MFVDAPLSTCEERDPKGLYRRARAGEVSGLTGIDAPYEQPLTADIHLHTDKWGIEDCVRRLLARTERDD